MADYDPTFLTNMASDITLLKVLVYYSRVKNKGFRCGERTGRTLKCRRVEVPGRNLFSWPSKVVATAFIISHKSEIKDGCNF